jgi:ubiquinone/menaquinone biosynthesis C-methylase UbiE
MEKSNSENNLPQGHIKGETGRDLTVYAELMDAALKAKAASIMPYFGQVTDDSVIVDVGSGTGQLAEYVAGELHNAKVYAVDFSHDMLALADKNLNKIHLVQDDATILEKIPANSVNVMYHGTVGHEIQTFRGLEGLDESLTASFRSLKNGGREIWRDFVKPADSEVFLEILTNDGFDTVEEATQNGFLNYSLLSTRKLFDCFYEQFKGGKAFEYELVSRESKNLIKMPAKYAQEFILRKDYTANWRQEIEEEYTYWTQDEAKSAFERAGFSEVKVINDDNEYIRKNRLTNKVAIYREDNGELKPIEFITHMVIVGEKQLENGVEPSSETIKSVDFQSLLDSVEIGNNAVIIDGKEIKIDGLVGQGQHKQVFLVDDGEKNKVLKVVRKDKTTFYSAFSSLQQSIERQYILDNLGVKHMRVYDYDRSGPPYRYLIQERIPEGSTNAADLIRNGNLTETDVSQMAEVINKYENGKQWQLDTNPFNWFRSEKDGQTQMVYIGGTVYKYNEAWSFDKVGLLQWIDPRFVDQGLVQSARVPNQHEAADFAKNWQLNDNQVALWWKKYLNPNIQPK